MSNLNINNFVNNLSKRREHLGVSQSTIAKLAGLSLPTVQRFFSHKSHNTSLEAVSKIAGILGVSISFDEERSEQEVLIERAKTKARKLLALVQGTSALEAQGLNEAELKTIENDLLNDLMKGSRSKIWND